MKKCSSCNQVIDGCSGFCPYCGARIEEEAHVSQNPVINTANIPNTPNTPNTPTQSAAAFCPKCGAPTTQGAAFCPKCGTQLGNGGFNAFSSMGNTVDGAVNRVKNSEFVSSVRHDVGNSQSISYVKNRVKTAANKAGGIGSDKKKIIIIASSVAAVLLLVLIIVFNIHTCDECGDTYFGKKYKVSFWGETEYMCKDCYHDFTSWRF